MRLSTKIL